MSVQQLIKPRESDVLVIPNSEFHGIELWDLPEFQTARVDTSAQKGKKERGKKRDSKTLEVVFDGIANGPAGFAVHLRDWARHLDNYGVKVNIPENRDCEYQEVAKLKKTKVENPIELLNYPGCSFRPLTESAPAVIGYAVFETNKFPVVFKQNSEGADIIWTASQFCYDRFVEIGIPKEKVEIFPEGVDTTRFRPDLEPLIPRTSSMRFLNVCGYSERKGMRTLISAFLKEFDKKEDDVELWIFGGWYSKGKAQEEVDELKQDIKNKTSFPRIILDWTDRLDDDMPGLFNSFDAGVYPTKGEGYCRPLAECAACGVPVITTNYAPMSEIITEDRGYLIDVDHIGPEPRADWVCEFYKGADFVHPSEESLRALMRDVFENYETAEAKAERGREYIVQHHNTATIIEKVVKRLKEIRDKPFR